MNKPFWDRTLIKGIDGLAAVNLLEPSAGDLERIVEAYHKCIKERDTLQAKLKELDKDLHNAEVHVKDLIAVNAKAEAKLKLAVEALEHVSNHTSIACADDIINFANDILAEIKGGD